MGGGRKGFPPSRRQRGAIFRCTGNCCVCRLVREGGGNWGIFGGNGGEFGEGSRHFLLLGERGKRRARCTREKGERKDLLQIFLVLRSERRRGCLVSKKECSDKFLRFFGGKWDPFLFFAVSWIFITFFRAKFRCRNPNLPFQQQRNSLNNPRWEGDTCWDISIADFSFSFVKIREIRLLQLATTLLSEIRNMTPPTFEARGELLNLSPSPKSLHTFEKKKWKSCSVGQNSRKRVLGIAVNLLFPLSRRETERRTSLPPSFQSFVKDNYGKKKEEALSHLFRHVQGEGDFQRENSPRFPPFSFFGEKCSVMSTVKLPCSLALLAQWGEEEEDFKQMGRKRGGGEISLGCSFNGTWSRRVCWREKKKSWLVGKWVKWWNIGKSSFWWRSF